MALRPCDTQAQAEASSLDVIILLIGTTSGLGSSARSAGHAWHSFDSLPCIVHHRDDMIPGHCCRASLQLACIA